MKKLLFVSLLILQILPLFSQEVIKDNQLRDSEATFDGFVDFSFAKNIEKDNVRRLYEIDLDGFQKIKLTKTKSNSYRGKVVDYAYKHGVFRKKVFKTTRLKKELVKELMVNLFNAGMDTLKKVDCWKELRLKRINQKEFFNCMESNYSGACLDGDDSYFKIKIGKVSKVYSFECLSPLEKIKAETPTLRIHVIKLLKIINDKINLKQLSKNFFKNLKKGEYDYYGLSTLQIN